MVRFRIRKTAVAALCFGAALACEPEYKSVGPLGGEFMSGHSEITFNLLLQEMVTQTKFTHALEDMGDGTVKHTVLEEFVFLGMVKSAYRVEYLKKCLQEQPLQRFVVTIL